MDQINKNPGASTKTINTKLMEMSQELQFIGLFFFLLDWKQKDQIKILITHLLMSTLVHLKYVRNDS